MFAIGWGFLMLAVILAAASISHDSTYIFARRKMTRARVLLISLFALLAFIFIIISCPFTAGCQDSHSLHGRVILRRMKWADDACCRGGCGADVAHFVVHKRATHHPSHQPYSITASSSTSTQHPAGRLLTPTAVLAGSGKSGNATFRSSDEPSSTWL